MIVFLDTSALVKLYVQEQGSEYIRRYVGACDAVMVSAVAYPEGRAALARVHRNGSLDAPDYQLAKQQLETDWIRMVVLPATTSTLRIAGDLAEHHALRGFDAVHLACALVGRTAQHGSPVSFATWDGELVAAARREQFEIVGDSAQA
jgi:predicted nucleic acid-binding protein